MVCGGCLPQRLSALIFSLDVTSPELILKKQNG
jgi:hypothetical protein